MAGSSSQEVNQKACELEKLSKFLKRMMLEAAREMKAAFKAERKKKALAGNALGNKVVVSIQRPEDADVSLSPQNGRRQGGRKIRNEVVAEKVVCFRLPENIDVQNIKDVDKVKERLGKWRIQRRQRESRMSDAYYCHLRTRQSFRSIPEAVSFMTCEIDTKPTPKEDKGENEASDCESSSKKAKKDEEEKVEDFAHESVENWMYPNVEKSDYGVEYPNMSAHGDEALNYLQGKSTEQLLLEPPFYYQYGLFNLFSDENQNNNGKELQVQSTETVEAFNTTTEAYEENPNLKEYYSVEEGTFLGEKGANAVLQENHEPEFETFREAMEKLGNAHLEGIDDDEVIKKNDERYNDQLPDLTMDWKASESILDTFYDECDLLNHIPICSVLPDLLEFLKNGKN